MFRLIKNAVTAPFRAMTQSPAQKMQQRFSNTLENSASRRMRKYKVSDEALTKMNTAFDGAATKVSEKMADNMVKDMFPPFWKRRPLMTLFGVPAAGAAAYNMFSRQPGAVTGGEFKPSASELGRMAADEEFASELDQMHQAGLFDQPQGPQAPQAPTMAAAQGATSEQMPPQTTMQASTAGYGGRVASPAVAMEHGA